MHKSRVLFNMAYSLVRYRLHEWQSGQIVPMADAKLAITLDNHVGYLRFLLPLPSCIGRYAPTRTKNTVPKVLGDEIGKAWLLAKK